MTHLNFPTFDDVVAAAKRIEGYAHRTPPMTSRLLNEEPGAQVFFQMRKFAAHGCVLFTSRGSGANG
jgi:threo-3-hydroxy-L-aspartate ammonia-lyase